MLLKNNNGVSNLTNKLYKSDKRRNLFTLVSVILTTVLLTAVSYIGIVMYNGFESLQKASESVSRSSSFPIIIGIIFFLLVVIGSGYLIIYNIFYISIVNNIRFYGQLRTLGCTDNQIKKMVYSLGIKISGKGIPFGVILGLVIGNNIARITLKETIICNYINLNLYILPGLLGIIFTLLTLFISIRKPVKMLNKISAVEALKHNSLGVVAYNKLNKKTKKGSRIKNMARENMIKNKKKIFLSVLSISLSSTLLSAGIIMGLGLDVEEHARRENIGDVNVDTSHNIGVKINNEKLKVIEKIDGVKTLGVTYSGYSEEGNDSSNHVLNNGSVIDDTISVKVDKNAFSKEFDKYVNGYGFAKNSSDDTIKTIVTAMNYNMIKKNIDRLKIVDGKIDEQKLKSGNYLIINRQKQDIENGLKAGDKVELEKNGQKVELEVMAIVKQKDDHYIDTTLGAITISKDNLEKLSNGKTNILDLTIDTDKSKRNAVLYDVRDILKNTNFNITGIDEFKNGVSSLKNGLLLGIGIGTAVFLIIAILNMLNIAITDLLERKREFSILEAIGMERGMQKSLLAYEGKYYLILSSIFIIPLSLASALLVPQMVPIYGNFKIISFISSVLVVQFIIYLIMIVFKKKLLSIILKKESLVKRLEEF